MLELGIRNSLSNNFNRHITDKDLSFLDKLSVLSHYLLLAGKYGEEGVTFPNLDIVINSGVSLAVLRPSLIPIVVYLPVISSHTTNIQRCGRVGSTSKGNAYMMTSA